MSRSNPQRPRRSREHPVGRRLGLRPRAAAVAALTLAALAAARPAVAAPPAAPETQTADVAVPEPDTSRLPPSARQDAEELRRRLAAALDGGDMSDAELAGGFLVLGQLYHAFDLLAAAEEAYSAGLTFDPGEVELLHRRGLARRDLGSFAGAAADLRGAVEAEPQRVGAWVQLGRALVELGRPAEARAAFESARQLGARAAAEHGLGQAALAAGDPAAAVEHLQAALSLQPSASIAHGDLARAYTALGEEERAARHRAQAGEGRFDDRDPLPDELRRVRAMIAFQAVRETARGDGFDEEAFVAYVVDELGEVPGAVDRLREAVIAAETAAAGGTGGALEPPRLRLALAALLLVQGRRGEAIAELTRAIEQAPRLRDARLQLAGALAQEGRHEEALAHYDRLLADDPAQSVVRTGRAAVLVRLGRVGEARIDLEASLAAGAEPATRAAARTLLAQLAVDAGRLDAALVHLEHALQADPEHRAALNAQGLLLGRLARYREASGALERLVRLAPENARAREGEAVALILAGDQAAARARLEAGLAALPGDPLLTARLARLLAAASDRSLRDGERAVELALAAFTAAPTADAVETLAMAYAEAGDFDQAVTWQRRLLAAGGAAADRTRYEENLALYEAGHSCCAAGAPSEPGGSP